MINSSTIKLSKGAQKIAYLLKQSNYKFMLEYSFPDLRGRQGAPLRYDFAILNLNGTIRALIEFDGEGHFNQIKFFQKNSSDFKRAQGRDREKNKYALMHGIPLYRIPYWEIDNITTAAQLFNNNFKVKHKYHNDLLKTP